MAIKVKSFTPMAGDRPTVLILGLRPGLESLRVGQYYVHPCNAFWDIMGHICGARAAAEYAERIERLKRAGIALWDVLRYCVCRGCLDAPQGETREVANNLGAFLATHPDIRCIGFNGAPAARAFDRYVRPDLHVDLPATLRLITLPCSSRANTRLSVKAKLKQWQVVAQYLDPGPRQPENSLPLTACVAAGKMEPEPRL
jgi:TDG/mug DNA glycosylase family protein